MAQLLPCSFLHSMMIERKKFLQFWILVSDEMTSFSSGEEMFEPPIPHGGSDIRYYNDDPMMPIFGSQIRSLDTKMMVQYVISGINAKKAAKLVPSMPEGNFIFKYDSNFVENWKDVLSDDFGVWRPSGTKTLFYTREIDNSGEMKVEHGPKEGTDLRAKRLCSSNNSRFQEGCG